MNKRLIFVCSVLGTPYEIDANENILLLEDIGEHSAEALWSRLEYFLKAVIPVAEEAAETLRIFGSRVMKTARLWLCRCACSRARRPAAWR